MYAAEYLTKPWQIVVSFCSCGSNCKSCYGAGDICENCYSAGYVQFLPTMIATGLTYMVLIDGGLHCKHSSCCSACCTAALCRNYRLLGLQPILHVQPCFALKIDASQCECIKLHHRTDAYYCTAMLCNRGRCCSSSYIWTCACYLHSMLRVIRLH